MPFGDAGSDWGTLLGLIAGSLANVLTVHCWWRRSRRPRMLQPE
jgi:hypothetical protein